MNQQENSASTTNSTIQIANQPEMLNHESNVSEARFSFPPNNSFISDVPPFPDHLDEARKQAIVSHFLPRDEPCYTPAVDLEDTSREADGELFESMGDICNIYSSSGLFITGSSSDSIKVEQIRQKLDQNHRVLQFLKECQDDPDTLLNDVCAILGLNNN